MNTDYDSDDIEHFKSESALGYIPREKLETILEEIANLSVDLVEDPTLPDFGYRYLQSRLARCREYLNRVQLYLQITRRYEKNLRAALKNCEVNFELKVMEKLADDTIVRAQSSIEDRKALATTQLREEFMAMNGLKIDLLNLEETIKIIKAKYDDLKATSFDVRLQRQMVKDDKDFHQLGDPDAQGTRQNGMVPEGMPPMVKPKIIEAQDLLDPERRPDDLPEPVSPSHAIQIASFLNSHPISEQKKPVSPPAPDSEPKDSTPPVVSMSYEDLLR
ncbi:MAG TPA: hypothetical protein VIE65_21335 [Methylobacter sp.]|jgi:hypothetical protein